MKWKPGKASGDLIDRRGQSSGRSGGGIGFPSGGSGGGLPVGKGCSGGGMGMMLLLVMGFFLLRACTGGGGGSFLDVGEDAAVEPGDLGAAPADIDSPFQDESQLEDLEVPDQIVEGQPADVDGQFMDFLIGDINDVWVDIFAASDQDFPRPKMVLFDDFTESGCGGAQAQMGPHYCTLDDQVYLDLGFFQLLAGPQFDAGGDFAQAYVIAHEVGHHVQNVLGINQQVREASARNPSDRNELAIRMELQADCFAGVWAQSADARDLLSEGDVEEGLRAAQSVGDDYIQKKATGRIDRSSWTHGTGADRQDWFMRGMNSGDPGECDTFGESGRFDDN